MTMNEKPSRSEITDKARSLLNEHLEEINECINVVRILNKRYPHLPMEKRIVVQNGEAVLTEIYEETHKLMEELQAFERIVNQKSIDMTSEEFAKTITDMFVWYIRASTLKERNHIRIAKFFKRMEELFGKQFTK